MYRGRINKVIRDKGFGFISATDGREIFFNSYSLLNVKFDDLKQDAEVEFEVEKAYKGPRAFNVHLLK